MALCAGLAPGGWRELRRTMFFGVFFPVALDLLYPDGIRLGIYSRNHHHRRSAPYRRLGYIRGCPTPNFRSCPLASSSTATQHPYQDKEAQYTADYQPSCPAAKEILERRRNRNASTLVAGGIGRWSRRFPWGHGEMHDVS